MKMERRTDLAVVPVSRASVGDVFEDKNRRVMIRVSVPEQVGRSAHPQDIPAVVLADASDRGGIGVLLWISPGELVHVHEDAKVLVGRAPEFQEPR